MLLPDVVFKPYIYHTNTTRVSGNKKAQLTLTNPRDAKACQTLLQFDVKTSCRQHNDLFEVMQQPSAPYGEWYWRILLENSVFSPPRTCLTPHSGWTHCDINITYTSLKCVFNALQFRRWQYASIFIRLAVIASVHEKCREIPREFDLTAVQGYPRSSILVSMESPYVTSY